MTEEDWLKIKDWIASLLKTQPTFLKDKNQTKWIRFTLYEFVSVWMVETNVVRGKGRGVEDCTEYNISLDKAFVKTTLAGSLKILFLLIMKFPFWSFLVFVCFFFTNRLLSIHPFQNKDILIFCECTLFETNLILFINT